MHDYVMIGRSCKTLTVRDVPEPLVEEIRQRARRNRRSMQKEILAILQGALLDRRSFAEQLEAFRARSEARMTIDEIHAAIGEGRP